MSRPLQHPLDAEQREALVPYLPLDRRRALEADCVLPERTSGSALFADISGFSALTRALARSLGARRGAEELPRHLDRVYDALIRHVQAHGGSVVGFAGDSITCWFDGDDGSAACACAFAMQAAMDTFVRVDLPDRTSTAITLKVAVTSGPVRRLLVGDPAIQRLDVIAGATVARLAQAEGLATRGEVVVDEPTVARLAGRLQVTEWREGDGNRFALVNGLAPAPAPGTTGTGRDGQHEGVHGLAPSGAHDATLCSWVLPTVVERLRAGQGEFLTELRPVVAMFVGFAGLDYDGDEAAGAKLDEFVRRVQQEATRMEGTLVQLTVGDKGSYLYLAFGAPLAHEDDGRRAVAVAERLHDPAVRGESITDVRIGISQGTMRTGAYGGSRRRTYGALGDETNMAARLMSKASPGQTLVTEPLRQSVGNAFEWRELTPVTVKGRGEPLPIFEPTGVRDAGAHTASGPADLPLVGRDAELALLQHKLDLARSGHGQVVEMVAEAGMGKSHLAAVFARVAGAQGARLLTGRAPSFGAAAPYLAWREIFATILGLDQRAAGMPERAEATRVALQRLAPELLPRLPLLGPVLKVVLPDNELTASLDPELRKASREALLVDLFRGAGQQARDDAIVVLVVLEDVHWIDPLSSDLLHEIARIVADLPVLLLQTRRPTPEDAPATAAEEPVANHETVVLHRLSDAESEELLRLRLQHAAERGHDPRSLTADLKRRLLQRAEGNPFHLEALLDFLFAQGDESGAGVAEEWPDSLHSLVLSRIDRLTEGQKALLKAASVIGRVFRIDWLHGYRSSGSVMQTAAEAARLAALDVTPLESEEPLAYRFKQAVTRDVTYESLPYATRAVLHERLARHLEEHAAGDLEPLLDLLAFHYNLGSDRAKRREYLRRAGESAEASYANETALSWYAQLLPLLSGLEQVDVLVRQGTVLSLMGRYDAAHDSFRQALDQARVDAEDAAAARCMRLLGELLEKQGDYEGAMGWLERARESCEALGEKAEQVEVLLALGGNVLWQQGAYEAARARLQEALLAARELSLPRSVARALHGLANLDLYQGDLDAARVRFEESLATRREIGDRLGIANALNNLGIVAASKGDRDRARQLFEESLAIRREIGDRAGTAVALNNVGFMAADQGDTDAAHELYVESMSLRRELGDLLGTAVTLNSLGQLHRERGELEQAEHSFRESLKLAYEIGNVREAAAALSGVAAVVAQRANGSAGANGTGSASDAYAHAAALAAAAAARFSDLGAVMEAEVRQMNDAALAYARAALDDATYARAVRAGERMTLAAAVTVVYRRTGDVATSPSD